MVKRLPSDAVMPDAYWKDHPIPTAVRKWDGEDILDGPVVTTPEQKHAAALTVVEMGEARGDTHEQMRESLAALGLLGVRDANV